MNVEKVKKEIKQLGHIKVIFEPSVYRDKHIQKIDLQKVLEKSQISLRGWSFPHLPREDKEYSKKPYSIGNGIEFYTQWEDFWEIFRFYQSGQFLAIFALNEDIIGEVYGKTIKKGQYLDFISIIYKITEIILFIKNLVKNADIDGGKLIIEIRKTKDRELESIFSRNIFSFDAGYICRIDKIIMTQKFNKEKILNEPLEISLEFIKEIFNDFNWVNYSDQMIKTHQANFLNRRI